MEQAIGPQTEVCTCCRVVDDEQRPLTETDCSHSGQFPFKDARLKVESLNR